MRGGGQRTPAIVAAIGHLDQALLTQGRSKSNAF
jgi:hypothetical protein